MTPEANLFEALLVGVQAHEKQLTAIADIAFATAYILRDALMPNGDITTVESETHIAIALMGTIGNPVRTRDLNVGTIRNLRNRAAKRLDYIPGTDFSRNGIEPSDEDVNALILRIGKVIHDAVISESEIASVFKHRDYRRNLILMEVYDAENES